MESVDKLFSQALTAVVTSFSQHLALALRGELNPGVEYADSNANSSRQWLQMVGKKGTLVHFEGTMLPKEVIESIIVVLSMLSEQLLAIFPTCTTFPVKINGN